MKNSDKLFVICSIYLPVMLILMVYPQINYFYTYSVSLNSLVVDKNNFSDDPDIFYKTQQKPDSTCYSSPNGNLYCYGKPQVSENHGISYITGENGIQGELHFDPVDEGVNYFTIKNMTMTSDGKSILELADNGYNTNDGDGNVIYRVSEFEYSLVVEKFDTFISHCRNEKGTLVNLIQYLGIKTIDGVDYFLTWHTTARSDKGVTCNYPQIIEASSKHDFGI